MGTSGTLMKCGIFVHSLENSLDVEVAASGFTKEMQDTLEEVCNNFNGLVGYQITVLFTDSFLSLHLKETTQMKVEKGNDEEEVDDEAEDDNNPLDEDENDQTLASDQHVGSSGKKPPRILVNPDVRGVDKMEVNFVNITSQNDTEQSFGVLRDEAAVLAKKTQEEIYNEVHVRLEDHNSDDDLEDIAALNKQYRPHRDEASLAHVNHHTRQQSSDSFTSVATSRTIDSSVVRAKVKQSLLKKQKAQQRRRSAKGEAGLTTEIRRDNRDNIKQSVSDVWF